MNKLCLIILVPSALHIMPLLCTGMGHRGEGVGAGFFLDHSKKGPTTNGLVLQQVNWRD